MANKEPEELVGIKEIARRAKVSIGTVDRAIHNRPGVAKKTREHVLQIISELDYQPNLLAKRLATRKTLRIATLIPVASVETSFWHAPLQGIEQAGVELGQHGIVIDPYFYDQDSIGSFVEKTGIILQSKPDGILLAPSFIEESVSFSRTCKRLGIPYVLIDSDLPNNESLNYTGPDLFDSGYLSAHLASYLVQPEDKILIVNISREIDSHHHLLRKEDGFRAYFDKQPAAPEIRKIDIRRTDVASIESHLDSEFRGSAEIKVVFVTNSRVSTVAGYLEKTQKKVVLIGYDYIAENLSYLEKGLIDFLICQKPVEQAYRGITTLYQHLAYGIEPPKKEFMPIDIVTRTNFHVYRN
jgi:LacI family transcriptional regulator